MNVGTLFVVQMFVVQIIDGTMNVGTLNVGTNICTQNIIGTDHSDQNEKDYTKMFRKTLDFTIMNHI